jgi:hypothetical protein
MATNHYSVPGEDTGKEIREELKYISVIAGELKVFTVKPKLSMVSDVLCAEA